MENFDRGDSSVLVRSLPLFLLPTAGRGRRGAGSGVLPSAVSPGPWQAAGVTVSSPA